MKRFRSDMVLVYHRDAPVEVLEALGKDVCRVAFYEDVPPDYKPDPRFVEVARKCEHVFTTVGAFVPLFEGETRRAHFLVGGCDRVTHRAEKPDPRFVSDIGFIGGPGSEARCELIRLVDGKYDLKIYGRGWNPSGHLFQGLPGLPREVVLEHVFPREYRAICASANIVLGVDAREGGDLYFSNRTWLSLGCRAFLITNYVPGLEEFFNNHEHLAWYQSSGECLELIDHYLAHPAEREKIAEAGYRYVHEYYTFRHATAEIMARVFGEKWP